MQEEWQPTNWPRWLRAGRHWPGEPRRDWRHPNLPTEGRWCYWLRRPPGRFRCSRRFRPSECNQRSDRQRETCRLNTPSGKVVSRLVANGGKAVDPDVGPTREIGMAEEPAVCLEAAEGLTGQTQPKRRFVGHDVGDCRALPSLGHGAAGILLDHLPLLGPDAGANVHFAPADDEPGRLRSLSLGQHEGAIPSRQRNSVAAAAKVARAAIFDRARPGPLGLSGRGKRQQDHDSPPFAETMRALTANGEFALCEGGYFAGTCDASCNTCSVNSRLASAMSLRSYQRGGGTAFSHAASSSRVPLADGTSGASFAIGSA